MVRTTRPAAIEKEYWAVRVLEMAPSRGSGAVRPEGAGRARSTMVPAVRLVELRPGPTAVARATMRPGAIIGWLGDTLPRLAVALNRQRVARAGPAFARYTVHGNLVEVEAGFRIRHAIAGGTTVTASGLPGGPAAVATHVGSAASLDDVYHDLEGWLDEHSLVEAAPHWEVYPLGPRLVSDAGLTRIVVPCRRRRVPVRPGADVRTYTGEPGGRPGIPVPRSGGPTTPRARVPVGRDIQPGGPETRGPIHLSARRG